MSKLACLILVAALAACNGKSAPQGAGPNPPPAGGPAPTGGGGQKSMGTVAGKVLESLDSGGYTYLRLQSGNSELWAAVPKADVKVGATVELRDAMEMRAFTSKTLNRTFDRILFAQLGGGAAGAPPAGAGTKGPMGAMPSGHPPLPSSMPAGAAGASGQPTTHPPVAPAAAIADVKVPKASGPEGRTVAAVFADSVKLKDKAVVVHGVVVKFNTGIMNKNWIHLKDGTGSADKKDDDLTITTLDTVKVGDKVKIRGNVRKDKDFGFGYKYATIVEEAKVEPLK